MILDNNVSIKINNFNINHFKSIKNNIKINDIINVDIEDLLKNSRVEINVKCDNCGKIKKIKYCDFNRYGYNKDYYLCKKCKKIKNNNIKYGVDNVFQLNEIKEKIKETNLKKYGVDNISKSDIIKLKKEETNLKKYKNKSHLSNNEIKEKIKETNLKKYGVDNVSKSDIIKLKKEETNLKKYGVISYSKTDDFKNKIKNNSINKYGTITPLINKNIKEKIKKTNLKKYGFSVASKNIDIKNKIKDSNIKTKLKKIKLDIKNLIDIKDDKYIIKCDCNKNHTFEINRILFYKRRETNTILCTKCNPINKNISGLEIELINFIKNNYNDVIIQNDRKNIHPYELDIYLPDLNLAFEFNGLYWHNELYKLNDYHKIKTDLCNKKRIQLIHIYEDDWIYKKDIIKSMILNKLNKTLNKIYARKTIIKEIKDNKLIRNFLNKNHIQGFVGSSIKIGLFYKNELVSLMVFKKIKNNYDLVRFCNKLNTNVIGGASKLFKYFINKYNFNEIITFSDKGYSNGKLYEKLNFIKNNEVKPQYYYIINNLKVHKSNFSKSKLVEKGYNKNNSEHEIMLNRNIYRIYNSGLIKYIYKK